MAGPTPLTACRGLAGVAGFVRGRPGPFLFAPVVLAAAVAAFFGRPALGFLVVLAVVVAVAFFGRPAFRLGAAGASAGAAGASSVGAAVAIAGVAFFFGRPGPRLAAGFLAVDFLAAGLAFASGLAGPPAFRIANSAFSASTSIKAALVAALAALSSFLCFLVIFFKSTELAAKASCAASKRLMRLITSFFKFAMYLF